MQRGTLKVIQFQKVFEKIEGFSNDIIIVTDRQKTNSSVLITDFRVKIATRGKNIVYENLESGNNDRNEKYRN